MKKPISKLFLFLVIGLFATGAKGQLMDVSLASTSGNQGPGCGTKAERKATDCVKKANVATTSVTVEALVSNQELSLPDFAAGQDPAPRDKAENAAQPSEGQAYEKTKNVSRTFKVGNADKLSIDNQFGRVDVQTWNRNEILVEATITTRAETETKAQEILDHINIKVAEGSNLISFVTEREPMNIRSNTQKSFEINYTVKMPKRNPLRVSNKYGPVQLPDLDGPTELEVKYGKLTTGRLNSTRNKIYVAYSGGVCELEYVKGGDLDFKYSKLLLNAADVLNTSTAYSSITINKVENLAMESRYDTRFLVGTAGQITGNGSYSAIKIGSLRESASLNMRYCTGFEISNVSSSFKKLDLTGGYTGMALSFADDSAFNFEVDTQYGSVNMNQDLANITFREVRNTSSSYKGKYGKSSPRGMVNVTSKYGSVRFN